MFTPDSLSREGSPVPEEELVQQTAQQQQQQPQQQIALSTNAAQRSQPMLPPSAEELRINQSAATSANTVFQGT